MARFCFFLQPTRNGSNLVACLICVTCAFFFIGSVIFPGTCFHDIEYGDYHMSSEKFHKSLSELGNDSIAVLVITSQRVRAIVSHLKQLKESRPDNGSFFPIIISQDGTQADVTNVILNFINSTQYAYFIQHKDRPNWKGSIKDFSDRNYFYIAQHYKWALDHVFFKMNFSTVIITEEDLDIAADFFSYFSNARSLLYNDPTIWCISAWNDNGAPFSSDERNVDRLYRTDFFPGLGWMLISKTWKELSPIWPSSFWDDWMRQKHVRKERVCIRPGVSRTLHNMNVAGKGTSGGMYKNILAAIRLPDQKVDFSLVEMDRLQKSTYDKEFGQLIVEAKPITIEQLIDDDFRSDAELFSSLNSYRFVYNDPRDYRNVAKKFWLMHDVRSGMERTAYCGVVTFTVKDVRIFAVHKNLNLTLPFGSYPCSDIYDYNWDLMSKYLDFSELYCTKKKWQGKCDPKDPGMIGWFAQIKQLGRLKKWGEMIVF